MDPPAEVAIRTGDDIIGAGDRGVAQSVSRIEGGPTVAELLFSFADAAAADQPRSYLFRCSMMAVGARCDP